MELGREGIGVGPSRALRNVPLVLEGGLDGLCVVPLHDGLVLLVECPVLLVRKLGDARVRRRLKGNEGGSGLLGMDQSLSVDTSEDLNRQESVLVDGRQRY